MVSSTIILGANGGIGMGLVESAEIQVRGVMRDECDLSDDESVDAFFAGLPTAAPMFVVNATGNLVNGLVRKATIHDIQHTVDVNVMGSYRISRAFAAVAPPGSSLLLLSSVVGRLGVPGAASYGMCKSAIHGLVRSLSKELAANSCRVNAIEMGYFDVGMIERIPEDLRKGIQASIPLQRFGRVDELWSICRAVLANGYMTGQVVEITGGL